MGGFRCAANSLLSITFGLPCALGLKDNLSNVHVHAQFSLQPAAVSELLDLSLNPVSSSLQLPRAKVTAFLGWSSSRLLPRLAMSRTLGRGCRRHLLTPKPLFVKLNQTPGFSKLGSLRLSLRLLLCHPGDYLVHFCLGFTYQVSI